MCTKRGCQGGAAGGCAILSGLLDTTVRGGDDCIDEHVPDVTRDANGQPTQAPCGYSQWFEYMALAAGESVLVIKLVDDTQREMT